MSDSTFRKLSERPITCWVSVTIVSLNKILSSFYIIQVIEKTHIKIPLNSSYIYKLEIKSKQFNSNSTSRLIIFYKIYKNVGHTHYSIIVIFLLSGNCESTSIFEQVAGKAEEMNLLSGRTVIFHLDSVSTCYEILLYILSLLTRQQTI